MAKSLLLCAHDKEFAIVCVPMTEFAIVCPWQRVCNCVCAHDREFEARVARMTMSGELAPRPPSPDLVRATLGQLKGHGKDKKAPVNRAVPAGQARKGKIHKRFAIWFTQFISKRGKWDWMSKDAVTILCLHIYKKNIVKTSIHSHSLPLLANTFKHFLLFIL